MSGLTNCLGEKQNRDKLDDYLTDIKENWINRSVTEIKETMESKRPVGSFSSSYCVLVSGMEMASYM